MPVFGPLNGVRVGLVAASLAAAAAALFAGFTSAALILVVGVLFHGLGWLYLYTHRYPDAKD